MRVREMDPVREAGFTAFVAGVVMTLMLLSHYYFLLEDSFRHLSGFLFLIHSGFQGIDLAIYLGHYFQEVSFAFTRLLTDLPIVRYLSLISGVVMASAGLLLFVKKGPTRKLGWLLPILLIPELLGFSLNFGPVNLFSVVETIIAGMLSFAIIYAALLVLWPSFHKKIEGLRSMYPY